MTAAGAAVRLYDKGRGAGGRLATRRVAGLQFDHGAQYLTARGPGFAAALAEAGAAPWGEATGGQPTRWVGTPGMSALPRALAAGLDLRGGRHVGAIAGRPGAWVVHHWDATLVRPGRPLPDAAPEQDGPFDAVLVTLPPAQAAPLVAGPAPGLPPRLAPVRIAPCWTVLAAFGAALPLPDSLRPAEGPIGWAARDSSKPGRDAGRECWVIQAAPGWSRTHLEAEAAAIPPALLAALAGLAGAGLPVPSYAAAHRWRYSLVEVPLGEPCLWDPAARIGLAGDWCLGGRAEAAFDSGTALAGALLAGWAEHGGNPS